MDLGDEDEIGAPSQFEGAEGEENAMLFHAQDANTVYSTTPFLACMHACVAFTYGMFPYIYIIGNLETMHY